MIKVAVALVMLAVAGMVLAMPYAISHGEPGGNTYVPAVQNSQNISSTLYAYIYGEPTPTNPFAGYSIQNETSVMPPVMFIVVHSYGQSTVQVSWSGSTVPISDAFSWSTQLPFNSGQGTYLVEITIFSVSLDTSVTQQYTINVMNYTQYITYENNHNPVSSTVLEPWYVQYEAAEAGASLAAIMVTVFYFYAQIQWENKEKKQKLFDVE